MYVFPGFPDTKAKKVKKMKKIANAKPGHHKGAKQGKPSIRDRAGVGGQEGLQRSHAASAMKRVLAASKMLQSVQNCRVDEGHLLTDRLSELLAQAGESPRDSDCPVADRKSILDGTIRAVDALLSQKPEKTGLSREDSAALAALGVELERSRDADEYVAWLSRTEPASMPRETGMKVPQNLEEWGRGAGKGPVVGRGV